MPIDLLSILCGVIANVLTMMGAHLGRKIVLDDQQKNNLETVIKDAIENVSDTIDWDGEPRLEEICLFIGSPEVESIIRQIYSIELVDNDKQTNIGLIKDEFQMLFSRYFGIDGEKVQESSKIIIDTLIEGCNKALNMAIENGMLPAHELKSIFRFHMLFDAIETLQKNLDFIIREKCIDVKEILEYEKLYRQQVAYRHGYIIPPHFDSAHKVPIDSLYVCSSFTKISGEKEEKPDLIELPVFLKSIFRTVILGDPGSGKSTLTQKLCHDLSTHYSDRMFAGRQVTPILVILRDYGPMKKEKNCSILQFIEITANSNYQKEAPYGTFEYLLLNGRALIIFDGLDELIDTSYRREIRDDVESFCNLYPSVPVLVTSRKIGYDQTPIDEKQFDVYQINPFNDEQINEYVEKWFNLDDELTDERRKQYMKDFLVESQSVTDLRANPLMLALLCNIYRGLGYIPKNRPEVYEACSKMLFERWDKGRGIHVPTEIKDIEAHIMPTIMYLANWIYSDSKLQSGVTEKKLIAKSKEYLYPRRFEDPDEAEKSSRDFVEFCKGRAWVFTNVGTKSMDEELFQFTHRSFLEYFTAAYIVRSYDTTDELFNFLLPKISNSEWDLVSQLAFQIKSRDREDAGDILLNSLIEEAKKFKDEKGWNMLSFASRCLGFIIPSPKITRDIIATCLDFSLTMGLKISQAENKKKTRSNVEEPNTKPDELIRNLIYARIENRRTILDCIKNNIIEYINSSNELEAILALEIGFCISVIAHSIGRHDSFQWLTDFETDMSNHILEKYMDRVKEFCPKCHFLCGKLLYRELISLDVALELCGFENIFQRYHIKFMPNVFFSSIASNLLNFELYYRYGETLPTTIKEPYQKNISDIGRILFSHQIPWVDIDILDLDLHYNWELDSVRKNQNLSQKRFNTDELFGFFTLFASALEKYFKNLGRDSSSKNQKEFFRYLEKIKKTEIPIFDYIKWIFLARFMEADQNKVLEEMAKCGFSNEQKEFIWRWIRHEIDFVSDMKNESDGKIEIDSESVDKLREASKI